MNLRTFVSSNRSHQLELSAEQLRACYDKKYIGIFVFHAVHQALGQISAKETRIIMIFDNVENSVHLLFCTSQTDLFSLFIFLNCKADGLYYRIVRLLRLLCMSVCLSVTLCIMAKWCPIGLLSI